MAASFEIAMGVRKFDGSVTVDCANGVGGPKLDELIKYLPSPSQGGLEIKVVNDDVLRPERLNHQVSCAFFILVWLVLIQASQVWSGLCQNKSTGTAIITFGSTIKMLFTGRRCRQDNVLLH